MKTSLEKHASKTMQSSLYVVVADLLTYLSVKSEIDCKPVEDCEQEEQKMPQQFREMLNWFWEGLSYLCLKNLKSAGQKVGNNDYCSISLLSFVYNECV